jgi:CBS domain-containing protein
MTIAAILKHKGHGVISVRPTDSVAEVVQVLASHGIGAAVVLDPDSGQLLGILSERDIVRALATRGAAALQMAAQDLMTRTLHTASPATTVGAALAMMTEGHFRHLPVMQHAALIGLVSIGDVVKAKLTEQEAEVDGLRAYVAGAA